MKIIDSRRWDFYICACARSVERSTMQVEIIEDSGYETTFRVYMSCCDSSYFTYYHCEHQPIQLMRKSDADRVYREMQVIDLDADLLGSQEVDVIKNIVRECAEASRIAREGK